MLRTVEGEGQNARGERAIPVSIPGRSREPVFPQPAPPGTLAQQIAEAVASRHTPLSRLLRLMAALDTGGIGAAGAETLRRQLRARIGAPLPN